MLTQYRRALPGRASLASVSVYPRGRNHTSGMGERMDDADRLWQQKQRRAFWLKQFHQWHWVSSAMCMIGMIVFAFTGITLNHASQIESRPAVVTRAGQLPPPLLTELKAAPETIKQPLPASLRAWISENLSVKIDERSHEWSADEIYVALPRAGGDAWLSIDRDSGKVSYERTDRGWIAYLNDLHKGRNTGAVWGWFIDIFAAACLVFCLTGLLLLKFHASRRPATWPMVGLGLIVPMLLLVLFAHQ